MSSNGGAAIGQTIKILIVEDSATARQLLCTIIGLDPQLQVCGLADNGQQAVNLARSLRPDLILMDIEMPILNGFEATKQIMAERPTPIIVVSSYEAVREVPVAVQALRAGALTIFPKPSGLGSETFQRQAAHLLMTIKTLASVALRRARSASVPPVRTEHPVPLPSPARVVPPELVVAAASTGGPAALHQILSSLSAQFTAPMIVVQHMAEGFISGLASSLGRVTRRRIAMAHHLIRIEPNTVYLAPFGRHLVVRDRTCLALASRRENDLFCPAANMLFASAAQSFGAAVVALVLTGMGNDGLEGCRAVGAAGGLVVAQDEESSMIFGMPKEVIAAGLAQHVLPLDEIPRFLGGLPRGAAGSVPTSGRP